jgi:NAD(P)-dependent dehydrogenase (short-subunit alcohol dehydrogenase family)
MRVKDKVAIVTGGGQGIGEGIALRLAEEGAKTVIVDINLEPATEVVKAIEDKGGEAIVVQADISKKADVEGVVNEVLKRFGTIDILVNNAGISSSAFVTEITEEMWDRVLAVNLKGSFLMGQAVIPTMQEKEYGKIINIASGSIHGSAIKRCNYVSSKAGIIGLTRSLARELAPYRINVNCVSPGVIETPLAKRFIAENVPNPKEQIPLGRLGKPLDIANAVLFFASDESEWITGEYLSVGGGRNLGAAWFS